MFFDPFAPTVYVLSPEKGESLVPEISFGMQSDRSKSTWVGTEPGFMARVVEAAGLSWSDMLRASRTPHLSLPLDEARVEELSRRSIYSAELATFSDHYFLQYYDTSRVLAIKYQRILGSKSLTRFSVEKAQELFDRLVEQARAFGTTDEYAQILARSQEVQESIARREAAQASKTAVTPSAKSPPFLSAVSTSDAVQEQLGWMRAQGNCLMLPQQQMSEYAAVKRLLETAGAKYVGKRKCFAFPEGQDAQAVLDKLLAKERVNPKKEFQFFASTQPVVELMRSNLPDLSGKRVLEPSAGDGVLADLAKSLGADVSTVELWEQNVRELRKKGYSPLVKDFLQVTVDELGGFDAILANPPFTGGQDIEHFMHMLKFLKPGGTLCCVMSTTWQEGRQRKQQEFKEFLSKQDVSFDALPPGTFKDSGTSVGALMVTLRAPLSTSQQAPELSHT